MNKSRLDSIMSATVLTMRGEEMWGAELDSHWLIVQQSTEKSAA